VKKEVSMRKDQSFREEAVRDATGTPHLDNPSHSVIANPPVLRLLHNADLAGRRESKISLST